MSRDMELLEMLLRIDVVARQSESAMGGVAEMAAWTDAAALREVRRLASRARLLVNGSVTGGATVAPSEAPQSSVEIETMAKGAPKVKVKVYDVAPDVAGTRARALYAEIVGSYMQPAKTAETEAP